MTQTDIFPVERPTPEKVVADAIAQYAPVATFALFSGGNGSLAATHWAMNNVPNCQVAHIDTGIGIPRTQQFVRETCEREGWPLTIIRAKEDCGQDYDQIVLEHGFPGPGSHNKMYIRLKERCIEELVRRNKKKYSRQKVMLLTGIVHDDSQRRSGYGDCIIKTKAAQLWVNAMYWRDASWMHHYVNEAGIQRNPVAYELGMSGECLCGAFAGKGELALVRIVCPAVAERIERLQEQVRFTNKPWGWEDKPPKERADKRTIDMFMCRGCLKEQERRAA